MIIAQLSRQRYKGSLAWGVLCSAFFHNNNNGVRELSDPRSFWGWHTTTLQSLSLPASVPALPPPHTLYGSLSPIHRATCHTPSLNTPIDARGDEVVGVQLRSYERWRQLHPRVLYCLQRSQSSPLTVKTETLFVQRHNKQSSQVFTAPVTSVLIHSEWIIP